MGSRSQSADSFLERERTLSCLFQTGRECMGHGPHRLSAKTSRLNRMSKRLSQPRHGVVPDLLAIVVEDQNRVFGY